MKKLTYLTIALMMALALVLSGGHNARAQSPTMTEGVTSDMMGEQMDRDDVLVDMTALHTQHTDLMAEAMRKQYSNAQDFEAAREAMNQNAQQIGMLINSQFNEQARQMFSDYWDGYSQYFLQYAEGLRTNDEEMQNEALVGLHRNINQASEMIAEAHDDLSQEQVDEVLRTHVDYMRTVIEAYDNNQYAESYDAQIRAQDQISRVAQLITDQMDL